MRTNEVMEKAEAVARKAHHCGGYTWISYVAYKRLRGKPGRDTLTLFAETTTHDDRTLEKVLWVKKKYSAKRQAWELGGLPQEITS